MALIADDDRAVRCTLEHLVRDPLFLRQKPYATTDFIPAGKPTNHSFDLVDVTVHDARPHKASFSLDKQGFCFRDCATTATFESLRAGGPAVEEYHREVEDLVRRSFPEYQRVEVIDHWLRRRDPAFPNKASYTDAQPACLPHIDFSVAGLFIRLALSCPGQEDFYLDKDFDIINVWRVLRGPNNDWPLAVCDSSTVESGDSIPSDYINKDYVGENQLLHANPAHRWYYLSDQEVNEVLVFRNNDSKGRRPRAFHAAVDIKMDQLFPRESVEVRLVAFR